MPDLSTDPQQRFDDAQKYHDIVQRFLQDRNITGFVRDELASKLSNAVLVTEPVLATAIEVIVELLEPFGKALFTAIKDIREANAPEFSDLLASALSDLLSVDISASDVAAGAGGGASTADPGGLGGKLHEALLSMLGGLSEISPATGQENARKFTGFMMNFSFATAALGILGGLVPVGHVDELRELGDELAKNLGLGRLTRLALQPLIRNMIQQPYDLYLKSQLRPDRLSEAQIVRALHAGQIDEGDAHDALAEKGYRDDDIDLLIKDLAAKLSAAELVHLVRYNELTEDAAIEKLKNIGLPEEDARLQLKAAIEARGDSQLSSFLSWLEGARLNGFIDQETFSGLVSDLPLGDEEDRLYRKKVAAQLEYPRKRITFAQLKAAVVGGHVDFTYVDEWLSAEGYSDQDNIVLTMEVIDALQTAEAKAAAKKVAHAKTSAKGKTPPPTMTP